MVDDLTRPTPAAELLPLLVEELTSAGIPPLAITVLLAGGTHPPSSAEEMAKKVGSGLSPAITVMAHDSRRDLVDLGVSPVACRSRSTAPYWSVISRSEWGAFILIR